MLVKGNEKSWGKQKKFQNIFHSNQFILFSQKSPTFQNFSIFQGLIHKMKIKKFFYFSEFKNWLKIEVSYFSYILLFFIFLLRKDFYSIHDHTDVSFLFLPQKNSYIEYIFISRGFFLQKYLDTFTCFFLDLFFVFLIMFNWHFYILKIVCYQLFYLF